MLRGPKTPLEVKENESGCPDHKEKASREQKSCKVTKSKVIRPSKKENFTDGNQPQPPKRALKCPKSPKQNLGPPQGVGGSCFGVLSEPPLNLHTKEDFSSSPAAPLGNDFTTPERDKVRGKADFGLSEQRNKADFAAVISAEFGIPQESFGKRPTGASPKSLKFRRRSTIGLRGSPENNSLIQYLAQQRSSKQRETFTQISPFQPANVRSLKDKIDAFQASFESLQESEGESELSHLGKGASSQDKAPFLKEPNLEQWNEKFMLGNRGAAWKENFSKNGSKNSRSELRICSILSPVTVTDPAAAQEWVYEQQNPIKSLETVLTGDTLEKGHGPRCEHSDAASAPSTSVDDESLAVLGGSQGPVTPLGTRSIASSDLYHSSSLLRSILKKTPGRELRDSPKEYSKSAIGRGGDESAAISNCEKTFETLQTEPTDTQSPKTPKKKKVTFGEVLSPEIFDQSLPANTPLRRGASPGKSPWARLGLPEQPLPVLDLGWDEEGVEPLPEFLEGSAAAVENAEVAETDKPDMITCSSTKRKQGKELAEDTEGSSCGATTSESDTNTGSDRTSESDTNPGSATNTGSDRTSESDTNTGSDRTSESDTNTGSDRTSESDTSPGSDTNPGSATNPGSDTNPENPRRSKIQRQKNPTSTAAKKPKKTKYPSFGKRRKKKVKKSLYGEREMASKKPLLSPIPEIPELFSFVSSPNSPLLTGGAAVGVPRARASPQQPQAGGIPAQGLCAAAGGPEPGETELPGRLEAAAEFSDAEGDFGTSEHFQQGKDTPCEKEAKGSSSLLEKEEFQGNLTELEVLDQQESAQRTKDSVRADPARRRRRSSSALCFPPAGSLEMPGADAALCCYRLEEALAGPLQGRSSSELRVRRSMRLSRGATEGLAWIQLPPEPPKQPPKSRRSSSSTSILAGAENVQHREQTLLPLPAPGKENESSAPARRGRRRSLCEASAPETPWAPTQRRRSTNSGCGKDRSNQKHSEAAETLELRLKDVSGISDFLK